MSETVLYNYTETTYLPVSALGTRLLYNYELVCLQNSQGIFCNYLAYEGSLQLDANASAYLGMLEGSLFSAPLFPFLFAFVPLGVVIDVDDD